MLVMGISFQARHYYCGDSATARRFYRSWWSIQTGGDSHLRGSLCLFWGGLNTPKRRSEMQAFHE